MKSQMKMISYTVEPEELPVFEKYYQNYNIDLKLLSEKPTLKNTARGSIIDSSHRRRKPPSPGSHLGVGN